jgi:uncharacterized protein YdgA (DUF945 family)
MKKLLIALVALAVLLLASYAFVGTRVEPAIQEMLGQASAGNPNLVILPKSKAGGLFSSRYVFTISFTLPPKQQRPGAPLNIMLDINYDVAHGPIPFAAGVYTPCLAVMDATFALTPQSGKEIRSFFDMVPELASSKARARLGFDSSLDTQLTVPGFSRTFPDARGMPTTVTFKGLTGHMASPAGPGKVTGQFFAPSLAIQDKDAQVTLDALALDVDASRLRPGLWAGTYKFRAGSLNVAPKGQDRFALRDLLLDAALTQRQDVADYAFTASAGYAMQSGRVLPVSLGTSLKNLDIGGLEQFITLSQKPETAGGDFSRLEPELRAIANILLARSPYLEFSVKALEKDKQMTFSCDIRPEGMTTLPQTLPQAAPMLRVKADLSCGQADLLEAACSLAAEMKSAGVTKAQCAQDLTAQIDQAAATGFVTRAGDKLSSKASWDGREFTVNGKPLK